MLSNIWNTLLYKPLINGLAFLISIVPGGDVGIAVIVLTILVKLLLFPLSERQIRNQAAMNLLAPELSKIKANGASKEEQAKQTFELYKKHKTNPFSGCLLVLIQIPIIFALYYVFFKEINFESGLLYSFIHVPTQIKMIFLGLIDIGKPSLILAVLAAVSQYFQFYLMPKPPTPSTTFANSLQVNLSKSMNTNMQYFFPILIFVFLYTGIPGLIVPLSGVIALYWVTSNIFTIGQQIYVNKTEKKILAKEIKVLSS